MPRSLKPSYLLQKSFIELLNKYLCSCYTLHSKPNLAFYNIISCCSQSQEKRRVSAMQGLTCTDFLNPSHSQRRTGSISTSSKQKTVSVSSTSLWGTKVERSWIAEAVWRRTGDINCMLTLNITSWRPATKE